MKLSMDLMYQTSPAWVEAVLNDFDSFLQDHADCERKASAMAMSFVAKCPDKIEIIPQLIETALEELEHFQLVYQLMEKRGVMLKKEMAPDEYIQQLLHSCRSGKDDRLMDRMLVASIVECRGAERFRLLAEALQEADLKQFYKMLWISEAKHGNIFVDMALRYWSEQEVNSRLTTLTKREAEICENLVIKPALH